METVEALVIGAGVVGLAVARALARRGLETLVLEQDLAVGQGISSRNSEVIHAGLYYPTGSLKARCCVRGRRLLYDFCEARQVPHRRCGKLLVATAAAQRAALEALAAQARANGVDELQWLGAAEAQALEPALRAEAALLSPSTGIIDSHALMQALEADLEAGGGQVLLRSRVLGWHSGPEGQHVLQVASADGEVSELGCRVLVNAAGLWATTLAESSTGLPPGLATAFCKGSYFSLQARSPFSRLIYPMPEEGGLGVHLTLDLACQARFGPDVQWLPEDQTPEGLDYAVDPARMQGFEADIRRYWPGLPEGALQPAYSGVRPKLHRAGTIAPDFQIDGPARHGRPGLVHLLGIESPGLTSCLALAEEVLKCLALDPAPPPPHRT
ncbi:MAG TPA: NAD(P)/FAD-dependent oxidoreductase [Burkholderiaceae bacterium]|nr:NAD(P)/FAD-dependent oxidoreductase [Burkholderiaceae bacterium]